MFNLLGLFPKMYMAWGGGDNGGGGGDVQESPKYQPSAYDAPASESIYNFYDPRIKGEKTGYSEEDLGTMKSQAIDQSTRVGSELERRGSAGRRLGYGGTSTGGTSNLREKAIQTGLEYRSNALRDIAIKNAVQKHQDQWNAATGMQNFLNSERTNALAKWTGDISMFNTQALADVYAGSQAAAGSNAAMGAMGQVGSTLLEKYLSQNLFKSNQGY